MTTEKQIELLEILKNPKYDVRPREGKIFTFSRKNDWVVLAPITDGHLNRYTLFSGKRDGKAMRVYGHIIMWIAEYGLYDDTLEITFKNRNGDDSVRNLKLSGWIDAITPDGTAKKPDFMPRLIRSQEIQMIRELTNRGINSLQIARELNLARTSVQRTVNKIKNGEGFRFGTALNTKLP